MKTLSLWQPWATLMVIGAKTIETRTPQSVFIKNHRGALLIHATKTWQPRILRSLLHDAGDFREMRLALSEAGYTNPSTLPLGAILGSICVFGCGAIKPSDNKAGWKIVLPGTFATHMDVEPRDLPFGDFRDGRLGIISSHATRFETPIPATGKQGLWEFPDNLLPKEYR